MDNTNARINELVAKMVDNGYDACNASDFEHVIIRIGGTKICQKHELAEGFEQAMFIVMDGNTAQVHIENHGTYELIYVDSYKGADALEAAIDNIIE